MGQDRIKLALDKVPQTLLLPLWGRAQMTRAGSPILRDEAAVAIVDRLDYDFSRIRADLDVSKNLSWIARARQLDDKVKAFAAQHRGCTVVNVGAGFDTTFSRVDDGRMRWIDLDLPEVIEMRRGLIPETERSRCVACSVLDSGWTEQLGATGSDVLFVAGGVLFYFAQTDLVGMFRAIGRRFAGSEIVFDAMTSAGVKKANGMLRKVGMETAVIQWGLSDARELESWQAGMVLVEQYEFFRGLDLGGIPLKSRVMTLANRLLRVMTIVHCRFQRA